MSRLLVILSVALCAGSGLVVREAAAAQVELDRIVSRAGGRIITQSDIRRARALHLVDDVSTDASTQRGLETRLLILSELDRAAPLATITADALMMRRSEWIASVGGAERLADLLEPNGMSEADLEAWLRDDLRIRAYLGRQFGMLPDGERERAIDEWIDRLRQRAELR